MKEYRNYIIRSIRLPGHETEVDEDARFFCNDGYDWADDPQNAKQFTFNKAVSKLFEMFDEYKEDGRVFQVVELYTTLKVVSVNTNVIDG